MEENLVCAKCKKNPGTNYQIFYGKLASKEKVIQGKNEEIVDIIEVGGSEKIPVCNRCITKSRILLVVGCFALAGIGGPFLIAMLAQGINWIIGLTVIGIGIFGGLFFLFESRQGAGERMATELRKDDLAKKGFEKVWGLSDANKIRTKSSTN